MSYMLMWERSTLEETEQKEESKEYVDVHGHIKLPVV